MKKAAPTMPLPQVEGAAAGAASSSRAHFPLPGWPLFRLGFRPFYLGAAAFGLVAVPYWIAGCWRRPKTEPLLRVVPTQN
jgi:uncharacterized protein involved in response to NO